MARASCSVLSSADLLIGNRVTDPAPPRWDRSRVCAPPCGGLVRGPRRAAPESSTGCPAGLRPRALVPWRRALAGLDVDHWCAQSDKLAISPSSQPRRGLLRARTIPSHASPSMNEAPTPPTTTSAPQIRARKLRFVALCAPTDTIRRAGPGRRGLQLRRFVATSHRTVNFSGSRCQAGLFGAGSEHKPTALPGRRTIIRSNLTVRSFSATIRRSPGPTTAPSRDSAHVHQPDGRGASIVCLCRPKAQYTSSSSEIVRATSRRSTRPVSTHPLGSGIAPTGPSRHSPLS